MKCRITTNAECVLWNVKQYGTSLTYALNWHNANENDAMIIWKEWSLGRCADLMTYKEQRRGMRRKSRKTTVNENCKILWSAMIQSDQLSGHRKQELLWWIQENWACPSDNMINVNEEVKVSNYDNLNWKIQRLWSMTTVDVILIAIVALLSISTQLLTWLKKVVLVWR